MKKRLMGSLLLACAAGALHAQTLIPFPPYPNPYVPPAPPAPPAPVGALTTAGNNTRFLLMAADGSGCLENRAYLGQGLVLSSCVVSARNVSVFMDGRILVGASGYLTAASNGDLSVEANGGSAPGNFFYYFTYNGRIATNADGSRCMNAGGTNPHGYRIVTVGPCDVASTKWLPSFVFTAETVQGIATPARVLGPSAEPAFPGLMTLAATPNAEVLIGGQPVYSAEQGFIAAIAGAARIQLNPSHRAILTVGERGTWGVILPGSAIPVAVRQIGQQYTGAGALDPIQAAAVNAVPSNAPVTPLFDNGGQPFSSQPGASVCTDPRIGQAVIDVTGRGYLLPNECDAAAYGVMRGYPSYEDLKQRVGNAFAARTGPNPQVCHDTELHAVLSRLMPNGYRGFDGGSYGITGLCSGTRYNAKTATNNSLFAAAVENYLKAGGFIVGGAANTSLPQNTPQVFITINTTGIPGGTQGAGYSHLLRASGGSGIYTFALVAGALPPGLTLNPNGAISGAPASGGTFNFTIQCRDSNGVISNQSASIAVAGTVSAAPAPAPAPAPTLAQVPNYAGFVSGLSLGTPNRAVAGTARRYSVQSVAAQPGQPASSKPLGLLMRGQGLPANWVSPITGSVWTYLQVACIDTDTNPGWFQAKPCEGAPEQKRFYFDQGQIRLSNDPNQDNCMDATITLNAFPWVENKAAVSRMNCSQSRPGATSLNGWMWDGYSRLHWTGPDGRDSGFCLDIEGAPNNFFPLVVAPCRPAPLGKDTQVWSPTLSAPASCYQLGPLALFPDGNTVWYGGSATGLKAIFDSYGDFTGYGDGKGSVFCGSKSAPGGFERGEFINVVDASGRFHMKDGVVQPGATIIAPGAGIVSSGIIAPGAGGGIIAPGAGGGFLAPGAFIVPPAPGSPIIAPGAGGGIVQIGASISRSALAGHIVAPGAGGGIIAPGAGGGIIAPGAGGGIIAPGAGIVAPGAGGIIAPGAGGGIIAPGAGGGIIAPGAGGGIIAPGAGGGIIAPGAGGGIIAPGAGYTPIRVGP